MNKVLVYVIKHRWLALTIYYLFWPISYPCLLLSHRVIRIMTFRSLAKARGINDEHFIFKTSADYLRYVAHINRWKRFVSKKWMLGFMEKQIRKLYNCSIAQKDKVSLDFFRTMVSVYSQYNMVGGAVMNPEGDTTVEVR